MEPRPSFRQLPIQGILSRAEKGSVSTDELLKHFSSRAELVEKTIIFSVKSSKHNIYEYEVPNSTSEKALGFLKNYYYYLSKDQSMLHKGLTDGIIKKFDTLRSQHITVISQQKNSVQNAFKEVTIAADFLEKAKRSCEKAKQEVKSAKEKLLTLELAAEEAERAHEEKKANSNSKHTDRDGGKDKDSKHGGFSMGRMLTNAFELTSAHDRDKQRKRVDRRVNDYVSLSEDITVKKRTLMDKLEARDIAVEQASIILQEIELQRLRSVHECLTTFVTAERASLEQRAKLLSSVEEAVGELNSEEDLMLFIKQEKEAAKDDSPHKYYKALALLDWDLSRRRSHTSSSSKDGEQGRERGRERVRSAAPDAVHTDGAGDSRPTSPLFEHPTSSSSPSLPEHSHSPRSNSAGSRINIVAVGAASTSNKSLGTTSNNGSGKRDSSADTTSTTTATTTATTATTTAATSTATASTAATTTATTTRTNDNDNRHHHAPTEESHPRRGNDAHNSNSNSSSSSTISRDHYVAGDFDGDAAVHVSMFEGAWETALAKAEATLSASLSAVFGGSGSINNHSNHSNNSNNNGSNNGSNNSSNPPAKHPGIIDHHEQGPSLPSSISATSNSNSNSNSDALSQRKGKGVASWDSALAVAEAEAAKSGSGKTKKPQKLLIQQLERREREELSSTDSLDSTARIKETSVNEKEEVVHPLLPSLPPPAAAVLSQSVHAPPPPPPRSTTVLARRLDAGVLTAAVGVGGSTSSSMAMMQREGASSHTAAADTTSTSDASNAVRRSSSAAAALSSHRSSFGNVSALQEESIKDSHSANDHIASNSSSHGHGHAPSSSSSSSSSSSPTTGAILTTGTAAADDDAKAVGILLAAVSGFFETSSLSPTAITETRDAPPPSSSSSSSSSRSVVRAPPSSEEEEDDKAYLDRNKAYLDKERTRWRTLLARRTARDVFLQELDIRRCRHSLLSLNGYRLMALALQVFLDICREEVDVKAAMRIANMSNTFHRSRLVSIDGGGGDGVSISISSSPRKSFTTAGDAVVYVGASPLLCEHHIWRVPGFWNAALMEGVSHQMSHSEPLQWDELPPDAVREAVLGVHNVVFGQLATISFTMHEVGMSYDEVRQSVLSMSRDFQLSEDQEHELLKSLKNTYKDVLQVEEATKEGASGGRSSSGGASVSATGLNSLNNFDDSSLSSSRSTSPAAFPDDAAGIRNRSSRATSIKSVSSAGDLAPLYVPETAWRGVPKEIAAAAAYADL